MEARLPIIERYALEGLLGEGGMGATFSARDRETGGIVAVKFLCDDLAQDRTAIDRFLANARALIGLDSAHLIRVLDAGRALDGPPYLVMERLEGRDLGQVLAEDGPLDAQRATQMIWELCQGLALAHERGLVHLDLKPENVFIVRDADGRERAKAMDFGAARAPGTNGGAGPGSAPGVPEYWSPELALGRAIDARSDVYSLGVLLHEALTGKTPFSSHSVSDVVEQHLNGAARKVQLKTANLALPKALEAVMLRCLAADPAERYASVLDLAGDLADVPGLEQSERETHRRTMMKTCPTCGKEYPDDIEYCLQDGALLGPASSEPSSSASASPALPPPAAVPAELSEPALPEDEPKTLPPALTPVPAEALRSPEEEAEIAAEEEKNSRIGTLLGSYYVNDVIGEGGMGIVYLAEHVKLGRKVAIKVLRQEFSNNAAAVSRFFHEARAVNQIGHENIIEVTDFFEEVGGDNYFVMELLEGLDLEQLLEREEQVPSERAVPIVLQVCEALAAAHEAGVIHRDLKPENIFLIEHAGRQDFVKLLDFGIAKLTDQDGKSLQRTMAGSVLGTPEYMSPEQAAGKSVDHRSDTYSLGVILYELVTGRLPFEAKSFGEYLVQHMTVAPKSPTRFDDLRYPVSPELRDVIMRCLEKEPADRYQSMRELYVDLEALLPGAEPAFDAKAPAVGRSWLAAALGGILGLAAVVTAVLFFVSLAETDSALSSDDEPAPAVEVEPSAPKIEPAPPAIEPAAAPRVQLAFESEPAGAEVFADGSDEPLGLTPCTAELDRGRGKGVFVFRLAGYEETRKLASMSQDGLVAAMLKKKRVAVAKVKKREKIEKPEKVGMVEKAGKPKRPGKIEKAAGKAEAHKGEGSEPVSEDLQKGGTIDPFDE